MEKVYISDSQAISGINVFRRKKLPKDEFFKNIEVQGLALTYDDVRLRTGESRVLPDDVNIESRFSRNVSLKIPIVSSPMDTVTEYKMAVAVAKEGGIGIIHRSLDPEEQAKQVEKVKIKLNALIENPVCVNENEKIEEILRRIEEKEYGFNTFPVLDKNGKLVGMLTKNDFDFCDNYSLTAKDIMTKELITEKKGTRLDRAYLLMKEEKKKALPLIDREGKIAGLYILGDLKRIKTGSNAMFNTDKNGQLIVGAAIGVRDDAYERLEKLVEKNVDVVVIDTSHADSKPVYETLKEIKKKYDIDVVVGNISEPESAKKLVDAGADGIKIGQGPGSICTTRIIAGIGCPQVTAVYNCAKAIRGSDIPVCADGGLKHSGDIPIAIGAGADNVMMGKMLAGTDESPGEVVFIEGRQYKGLRGMGSVGAMQDHKSSRERYGQTGKSEFVPEGIEGVVDYTGKLSKVIYQYVNGLRRGMGYVGAANIKELKQKGNFRRSSAAGQKESHPHDVRITKESPNYKGGGS